MWKLGRGEAHDSHCYGNYSQFIVKSTKYLMPLMVAKKWKLKIEHIPAETTSKRIGIAD